jgi:hypothetical protein
MDKAWSSYMNVRCLYFCFCFSALRKYVDFVNKSFHSNIWYNNVSLGAENGRGWKERGPLLLFNPLWDGVYGGTGIILPRETKFYFLSLTPCTFIL